MALWKRILLTSAGLGAGFAIVAVLIFGVWAWNQSRWSATAITAAPAADSPTGNEIPTGDWLESDKGIASIVLRYRLTNHTNMEYSLAETPRGRLFWHMAKDHSLQSTDGTWVRSDSLSIPPNQTVTVTFDPELGYFQPDQMKKVQADMKGFDSLVFFDYDKHYTINLPKVW
jgi:hypothetical protein